MKREEREEREREKPVSENKKRKIEREKMKPVVDWSTNTTTKIQFFLKTN